MKDCMKCRYCGRDCYEYSSYSCELFGEDIPEWASNYNDGCLLKSQEVKKVLKITSGFRFVGTGELDKYGFPSFTKEDEEINAKVDNEYKTYIETLKKRCATRRTRNSN